MGHDTCFLRLKTECLLYVQLILQLVFLCFDDALKHVDVILF